MPSKFVFFLVLSIWPATSMAACEFCQSLSLSLHGQGKSTSDVANLRKRISAKGFTVVERANGLTVSVGSSEKEQELRSLLNREQGERAVCKQMFKPGSGNAVKTDDNPSSITPAN